MGVEDFFEAIRREDGDRAYIEIAKDFSLLRNERVLTRIVDIGRLFGKMGERGKDYLRVCYDIINGLDIPKEKKEWIAEYLRDGANN